MTYFGFLLRFLVIPITLLSIICLSRIFVKSENKNSRAFWVAVGVHVLLALIYTTPWDNYLVATGVWYYNQQLVTGIVLGYVPIEEYAFFVLETLFVGLWWLFLVQRQIAESTTFIPSSKIRLGAVGALLIIWIVFTILFFAGPPSLTYLSIIFFWALPAIILQLVFGADILWHHRKLVALTITPMSLYLSIIDSFAIADSTWTISPTQSTGILLGWVLPIEEAIFFFVTVTLVTFGLTLFLIEESHSRLQEWLSKLPHLERKLSKTVGA